MKTSFVLLITLLISSCSLLFRKSKNVPWYINPKVSFDVIGENNKLDTTASLIISYSYFKTIDDTKIITKSVKYNKESFTTKLKKVEINAPYIFVTVNSKGHFPKTYYFNDIRKIPKNFKLYIGGRTERSALKDSDINNDFYRCLINKSEDTTVFFNFSLNSINKNDSRHQNKIDSLTLSVIASYLNDEKVSFKMSANGARISALDTLDRISWLYSNSLSENLQNGLIFSLFNKGTFSLAFIVEFNNGNSYRCLLKTELQESISKSTMHELVVNLFWTLEKDKNGTYYFLPDENTSNYRLVLEDRFIEKYIYP